MLTVRSASTADLLAEIPGDVFVWDEVLAARDRAAAGPTAPACGLCFMGVEYDEGALRPL